MDVLLMEEKVLLMFREEIPGYYDFDLKREVPLEFDTELQDFAPGDDFVCALEVYEKTFKVDLSVVNWSFYFPWENLPFFTRWFKVKRKDVEKTRKPLTVRMFAESAKAGKWLYD
ncbi:DUF1493 family protein [Rahnella aquatilis]|nr:DUF1493 family protein [Rahnella aquatilis]